jgi:hypothetical protein
MSDEIWKPVPGFEGYYEVSDFGRVRSLTRITNYRGRTHKGRMLNPGTNHAGYPEVTLCKPSTRQHWFIHELVLAAFIRPRHNGEITRHKDGNPENNMLDNLSWGTHAENVADSIDHGTFERGSMRKQAKLTETKVVAMRRAASAGMPIKKIAAEAGVAYRTAAHAIAGTKWEHVSEPVVYKPIVYLTDQQVREIRALLREGRLSLSEIGRRYGRPASTIQQIRDGGTYAFVK